MEKEIFKKIPKFDDYEVSNLGRIASFKSGERKVLKNRLGANGYYSVQLCRNGNVFQKRVHRLVMSVFEGENDLPVNHKDGDKLNNRLSNLEYVTHRQNAQHYQNTKKRSSKYIGVHLDKKINKWRARITIDGNSKHLGYFDDEQKASEAYQNALKELNLKMYKAK